MHAKKNNNNKGDEATLADIDRFLSENFKSLFIKDENEEINNTNYKVHNIERVFEEKQEDKEEEFHDHNKDPKLGPMLFKGPSLDIWGSNRFFSKDYFSSSFVDTTTAGFSSTSSSITKDLPSSSNLLHPKDHGTDHTFPDDCIIVLASSISPFENFRRSMEDMVEAKLKNHETVCWDFMQELLFCYIKLNEKKKHKFILSAFVDLITTMQQHPDTPNATTKAQSVRTIRCQNKGC
ncbi:hypothetical protein RIF29_28751 [Crotalaria pallida]|uniref:Transcription repressor n=1 Tax=Crotalaria pallida TaxID=3830 RepID=A0AAN9EDQ1_CROPI